MEEPRRLTAGEVSYFMKDPVWRAIALAVETQRRIHTAELVKPTESRKTKMSDDYLRGQIERAETFLLAPVLLHKRLQHKEVESATENEYTDINDPVDLG